jgi:hypothetical protein
MNQDVPTLQTAYSPTTVLNFLIQPPFKASIPFNGTGAHCQDNNIPASTAGSGDDGNGTHLDRERMQNTAVPYMHVALHTQHMAKTAATTFNKANKQSSQVKRSSIGMHAHRSTYYTTLKHQKKSKGGQGHTSRQPKQIAAAIA